MIKALFLITRPSIITNQWLLITGFWDDNGIWDDNAVWDDNGPL